MTERLTPTTTDTYGLECEEVDTTVGLGEISLRILRLPQPFPGLPLTKHLLIANVASVVPKAGKGTF